jgi:hypothetical protein
MPWKCPACRTSLQRRDGDAPRSRVIYRCHVCRLELVFNADTGQLDLAPFPSQSDEKSRDVVTVRPKTALRRRRGDASAPHPHNGGSPAQLSSAVNDQSTGPKRDNEEERLARVATLIAQMDREQARSAQLQHDAKAGLDALKDKHRRSTRALRLMTRLRRLKLRAR